MATAQITTADDLVGRLQGAKGGEVFELQGAFGSIELGGVRPSAPVTLTGTAGAHFERISMRNCTNLHWTSISCWPLGAIVQTGKAIPYLVFANEASDNIEVSKSVFRGRKDSDNHANWSLGDWQAAKIGGVMLRGQGGIIRSNAAIGVSFGFTIMGPNSELFDNIVFGFSADGLRTGGDNSVVVGNRVTDAVKIDRNHPDGFQAFKVKGLLKGLVIKDNAVLEWTVRPNNPLRAKLQGISLHDGPYSDVVIRDNRVSSSSYNGIRTHAVTNVEITGNQVRNADGRRGTFPAIRVDACTGRVVVSNNRAEKFIPPANGTNGKPDYSQAW